jgi:Glutamate-cysteine ligase family 2(GCS2)
VVRLSAAGRQCVDHIATAPLESFAPCCQQQHARGQRTTRRQLGQERTAIKSTCPQQKGSWWLWVSILLAQDPDRCGILPFVFDDDFGFARYAEFALDVPMYFVSRCAASCTQDARVPAVASAVKAPTASRRTSSSAACPPGLLHMASNDTHQPLSTAQLKPPSL